jgi:hypothetical protein
MLIAHFLQKSYHRNLLPNLVYLFKIKEGGIMVPISATETTTVHRLLLLTLSRADTILLPFFWKQQFWICFRNKLLFGPYSGSNVYSIREWDVPVEAFC